MSVGDELIPYETDKENVMRQYRTYTREINSDYDGDSFEITNFGGRVVDKWIFDKDEDRQNRDKGLHFATLCREVRHMGKEK